MDIKWLCIAFAVVFAAISLREVMDSYSTGQCKVAAIQTGKYTGQEIERMCK